MTLLAVATITGVIAFALGTAPAATVVVAVHGASGLGLLLLVPAKVGIARRGLRRPGRLRKVISLALAGIVALALAAGLLHAVAGFVPVAGLLPMQAHVGAAVLAGVLLAVHVARYRRWPWLRTTDVDRRLALRGAAVIAGAAALDALVAGRPRRFTGSHEVGSGDPLAMPVTQWLADPVLRIDPAGWRLGLPGGALDLAALAAQPQTVVRSVLDCTGGWYAEQEWRGVRVADLGLPRSASLNVISATGYHRRLPASDAATLLLATHVAGRPLSAAHGGPARLVAPGRRGFWWVKWVIAVEATDEPWWWQPPLPLQ